MLNSEWIVNFGKIILWYDIWLGDVLLIELASASLLIALRLKDMLFQDGSWNIGLLSC